MVSPSVPTGNWISTGRSRASKSWRSTCASPSHTSMRKRTNQRLLLLMKPWASVVSNSVLPLSRSRSRTRHGWPPSCAGSTTRAPRLKS